MTEPMRCLYSYVLDNDFSACLCTKEYRTTNALTCRLEQKLRQILSGEAQELFQKYFDAQSEQQLLELEAMFQAAFTLHRTLY